MTSNLVDIGFGSAGDFSFAWGNKWFFLAAFLARSQLATFCFLEGDSGELWGFDDVRGYVISRRDGGRKDFDTRENVGLV